MPFSPQTLNEKPYNVCVRCPSIGLTCDGPNFYAMTMERLAEWCRLRKEYLNTLEPGEWSNQHIAVKSNLSKATIDRFLAGKLEDAKVSTVTPILKTLVNGTWGRYPCDKSLSSSDLEKECEQLRRLNEDERKKVLFLKDQVTFKEEQMKAKDRLLAERYSFMKLKDRAIAILSVFLGIFVILFIAAILVDLTNSDKGFFWLASLRH